MCEHCGKVWWSSPDFFLWGFLKDLADSREGIHVAVNNVAPQMLHRLNTGWTLRMPLMRFTEHKVKKFQFSLFVAIGFIYRFVLVLKIQLFLLLYL